jgi:TetR/AcrR family transcriptional repressor of nem operon
VIHAAAVHGDRRSVQVAGVRARQEQCRGGHLGRLGGPAGVVLVMAIMPSRKSQLYHYFTDRQGLIRAVIARQTEVVVDTQSARLAQVGTWPELRRWLEEIVAHQQEQDCRVGCPIGSIAAEMAGHDDAARHDLAVSFGRWRDDLAAVFRRMRDNGEVHAGADPDQLATTTLATVQGALLLGKVHRSADPLRVTLDTLHRWLRAEAAQSHQNDQ